VRVLVVTELVPIAGAKRDAAAVRVLVVTELVAIVGAKRPAGKIVGTEDV